jgi:hypothetical protein
VDATRQGSPLYAGLALAIDGDEDLKALTKGRRPGQPAPNLLLAAVHFLLLRGADHPLRNFYPTLGGAWAGEKLLPLFRDFVAAHEHAVRHLIESRITNTNEVARSLILRAGFAALAAREPEILNLIEVGPSAGLNLIWDHYGMTYRCDGKVIASILPDSLLQLDCELRGARTPPLSPVPRIGGRVGLELHPVDLANGEDRDWLRALIWADQPRRLARLDRAIALFRRQPQSIRQGDGLALLPTALAEVPPGQAVCVYHSIMAYQFSDGMKEALAAILVAAGLRRPVWHLTFEFDGEESYLLTLSRHSAGPVERRVLARAHPHGAWMEWLVA